MFRQMPLRFGAWLLGLPFAIAAVADAAASTNKVHGSQVSVQKATPTVQASRSYTGVWRQHTVTSQGTRMPYTTGASTRSTSGQASATTASPPTRYKFTEVAPRSLW